MLMRAKGKLETYLPEISGLIALISFIWWDVSPQWIPNLGNLLAAIINIGAITVGFLITVVTLLIAIKEHPKLIFLSELKYAPGVSFLVKLIGYIKHAIGYGFLLSVLATIGLVFDSEVILFKYYFIFIGGTGVIFVTSLWRILKILSMLLSEVIK
ncbi:hypothetical protein P4V39_01095 [Brevibacillus borstelensis]|uniref:hypothetical protein n=1 Tax=Brevibacillus borstelensis TaxID=45462 RepID=UPI002E21E869|nr:hypothetical protein [Brevibacillus borstelensis]